LIPEVKFSVDKVCEWVESRFKSSYAPIIVIAEGAIPQEAVAPVEFAPMGGFEEE
jgi:6-phosphofructokinase 1